MSGEGAGWASRATAYAKKDGKLVRAQVAAADSVAQLLQLAREHFGVERALALVPSPKKKK